MNNWDSMRLEQIEENTREVYKALDRFALAMERIADALDRKTEPRGCDADCTEDCAECAKETELWKAEQTEPRKTTDYCDTCNHKGCDNCVADGSNPYCVPSHFEPKDEPNCSEKPNNCDEPQTTTDEDGRVWEYRNGNWWQLGKTEPQTERSERWI